MNNHDVYNMLQDVKDQGLNLVHTDKHDNEVLRLLHHTLVLLDVVFAKVRILEGLHLKE